MSTTQIVLSAILLAVCAIVCICCAIRENDGKKGMAFGGETVTTNQAARGRLKKYEKNYTVDRICRVGIAVIMILVLVIGYLGKGGTV